MSLDPALFTLHFLPRQASPSITDLSPSIPDASSKAFTPTYTLSRAIRSPKYQNTLLDGLTYTELGSISAGSTSEKCKTLRLFNPDQDNEVRKAGAMLRTEWQFAWQGEKLAISKELAIGVGSGKGSYDVEIVRKPDPPIKVAIYRPDSKKTFAFLQIFDYNIDRCEAITDKRGLEHTIILAIASCLDAEYDERHRTPEDNLFLSLAGAAPTDSDQGALTDMPPAGPLEPNEVVITPLVEPAHIVEHCLNLLKSGMDGADPRGLKAASVGQNLELVVIKAVGEEMARRAIGIAERVKVGFYRLPDSRKGKLWDGTVPAELFQYVRTSEIKTQTGPEGSKPPIPERPTAALSSGARPRIKLGGGPSPEPTSTPQLPASPLPAKTPPMLSDVTIFLSKTKLEEFEAERSQQARLYEEKQSRRLAERLQEEQARHTDSPPSLHPKGQASRRPISGGQQGSPDAARSKPAAHRDGRPTSAGGSSGSRPGANDAQDDSRTSESVSMESPCGSSGGPRDVHWNSCSVRAAAEQGSSTTLRSQDTIRSTDDQLYHNDNGISPWETLVQHDLVSHQNLKGHATGSPRLANTSGRKASCPAATPRTQRGTQTYLLLSLQLPLDPFLHPFNVRSVLYLRVLDLRTRASRPSGCTLTPALPPTLLTDTPLCLFPSACTEPPRSPLQPSPRDPRPTSFLVALQDDSAIVTVKVKVPDAPKQPVVVLHPVIARASSMAALLTVEEGLPGACKQYFAGSRVDSTVDADASGAGASTDDDDDAEEYGSPCEAECGSWYDSERSCSSAATSPTPVIWEQGIEALVAPALPQHCSWVPGLPPPILAKALAAGSHDTREGSTILPVLDVMRVAPAVRDSTNASASVRLGRLSKGRSGKKTLSLRGRWSSTPIRDLHEQWAADLRGDGGAVRRRKRERSLE